MAVRVSVLLFVEEVVEDRRLLVPVGARLLRGEGHVEQGGLGPWPADELEPDREAAPVVTDLDCDGRQAQEVPGYGVPDQRRCMMHWWIVNGGDDDGMSRESGRTGQDEVHGCKIDVEELIH